MSKYRKEPIGPWYILPEPRFSLRGVVYVHDEEGYRGAQDLLDEGLYGWKPGRSLTRKQRA